METKTFIEIKAEVIREIQKIYDPEIPINIYELGLIYDVNVDMQNNVHILMTLTSPSCPSAEQLPGEVEQNAKNVEGVNDVKVELTFEPPWSDELMSEAAKLELGFL
jgi:FeS assembly SUF system protein